MEGGEQQGKRKGVGKKEIQWGRSERHVCRSETLTSAFVVFIVPLTTTTTSSSLSLSLFYIYFGL